MEEKLQRLYEALSAQYDMGSLDEFKASLSDPEKLQKAYSFAQENFDGTGSIDEFKSSLFPVKKKSTSVDLSVPFPQSSTPSSSTLRSAPTAAAKSDAFDPLKPWGEPDAPSAASEPPKQSVFIKEAGYPKQSAFEKNADSIYKLTVTQPGNIPFNPEEAPPAPKQYSTTERLLSDVTAINKGFYGTAVGGTLKGVGELMLQGVRLMEPDAKPEDMWLWQAGNAIQKQFDEGGILEPENPELLETTRGQIGQGFGQMAAMILTAGTSAEGQAMSKIPAIKNVLKEGAKQFFSRPAIMGIMQMVDEDATNIRNDKNFVESVDRDTYVKIRVEAGDDGKLAGKKYDKLKESTPEDLIAEMLPTTFMAGSTEGFVVGEWFKRFNKATNGQFTKIFLEKAQDVTVGTFEGAAQEALQQWMDNATAQEVYDYTRSTTEGMAQSAKVGGGVQLIFEVMSAALGVKNRSMTGKDKELIEKAQEEIKNRETLLARNLETAMVEETPSADFAEGVQKRIDGEEITPEEGQALIDDFEAKKAAIAKTPEGHKPNPDVVDAVTEKTKVDLETEALKESIKDKDPAFTADEQAKIKENELKSAELSVKVSEAAGLAPDPKAVKALEPKEGEPTEKVSVKEGAKEENVPKASTADTALPRFGNMVVDPATMEMYPEGKPGERRPISGKTAREFADSRIDEFAVRPDTDLSGMSEQETARKILDEGSPAQAGQLWLVEPNSTQGEMFTKESVIEEAVTNSTFDRRALAGIPDLSSSYFPKTGERPHVYDLGDLADELSHPDENTNLGITEADVADYIRSNPSKTKPKKPKLNPVKRQAAQKFKELTGVAPTPEYVGRLAERSGFLKEKQAVEQEFPEAAATKPVQPASQRMKKALLNRVVEDPLIDKEIRDRAREGDLEYDVLSDEHVNAVAEFEISENFKSMDLPDALSASVKTAKNLLKEAVDTQDASVRETNGAMATAIILKSAFHFAENGMMKEAQEAYEWLDSYSRGSGRQIGSLRAAASPEGVAGNAAMKVFESQVRELSKRGKNATLEQMLKDLRKEIQAARNKEGMKAAKETAGKTIKTEGKKKDLKAERSDILARIKAKMMDQSTGFAYDPENEAKKAQELINDVGLLIRNLVESGITKVQEIYDNIVEAMKGIGFSDTDADRIAKDALLRTNDAPMATLTTGKQMDVSMSANELTGEITIIDKQKAVDEAVDRHYAKEDGRALWAELVEAGLTKKEALTYEKALTDAIKSKEKAGIVRAVNVFKKKIQEEEIEGIMVHEKKWNDSVDALVNASAAGLLNDQNVAAAVSGYFGFQKITAEDMADIKFLSSMIMNGLESYQSFDAFGNVLGFLSDLNATVIPEIGDIREPRPLEKDKKLASKNFGILPPMGNAMPGVPGPTIQKLTQQSPELLARAQKEMKVKLLEIEKRNNGIMPILAEELHTAMHLGALANIGTWANVIEGTISKLAPDLFSLSIASPVAAVRAIQKISESKADNWKMGWGLLKDAFKTNFSHLDNPKITHDGQYVNAASLVETAMVRGIAKYSDMYARASGTDKAKSAGKLVGAILSQAYRIAIAPKAIDGQLTHPVSEYVRFIEAWNKMSQGLKFKERVKMDFANKVAEYGRFTPKAWEMAKQQAGAEVAGMRLSGRKVPIGFEARRSKEIIHQDVRRSELESAQMFMDRASLRGEMTGFGGILYDKWIKTNLVGENTAPVLKLIWLVPKAAIGLFMRVAIFGANIVQKTIPGLSPAVNALSSVAVTGSFTGVVGSKFVGTARMQEYPAAKQLGNGYVMKSGTEKTIDLGAQVMANALFLGLFMAMFDLDKDKEKGGFKISLDPDRWVDISADLDKDPFTNEVGGMTRYSVRFRNSDGSWGKPRKFSLWLPFMAPMSVMGGMRDDLVFREDEFREKSIWVRGGAALMDVLGVFSEVSFNGLAQTADRFQKAGKAATKSDTPVPWLDMFYQTGLRPAKAIMPGVYKDLLVNELGAASGKAANMPKTWYERAMKDIPLLDSFVKHERYDEYGNPVYRDSKAGKIVERISFNYIDFVMANEETRKQPEWVLTNKFEGLLTPGQYFPDRKLLLREPDKLKDFMPPAQFVEGRAEGSPVTEEERDVISRAVAVRKGLIVNTYYEELNELSKQELEQMLLEVHNFAADIIKFEMGFSKETKEPKFKFSKKEKAVKEKIEENELETVD